MKILTLLRHAKSTWDDPVARDFDRPLNKRGQRAARTVGQAMRASGLRFDEVIASPAARVVETLREVGAGYGVDLPATFDRRVYLAPCSTLLDIVQHADDDNATLLIVGHNPGLETLALALTADDDRGLRGEIAVKYPTAALAEISLPVSHWRDVAEGVGTIVRFLRPRDLDPALGPDDDS